MKQDIDAAEIASKRFGQNFLKDRRYVDQIIQAMPDDDLPVVEIGPGLGDLTSALVQVRNVTAFEVDTRLCKRLQIRFSHTRGSEKLRLECGDVLKYWEAGSLLEEPYHLVANLPYYIATRLVLKALHDPQCQSILVMMQKEVALKFAAQPGERNFSPLSVLASDSGEACLCFEVPPEAFIPSPKVTSAVLSISKERTLEDPAFERFLKIAFAQPRKKLGKNLENAFDKGAIRHALYAEGIDPLSRPHEVAAEHYHHLYTILKKDLKDGKRESESIRHKR